MRQGGRELVTYKENRKKKQEKENKEKKNLKIKSKTYEVVLDELYGKGGLSYTTTTNNYKLVFGHCVLAGSTRLLVLRRKRRAGRFERAQFFGWFYAPGCAKWPPARFSASPQN